MAHKRYSKAVATVLLSMAVNLLAVAVLIAQPAPLTGLDAYIEQALAEWDQPGLSIAVVKDDSVVYARGFGVGTLGEPGSVDEHTIFAIASTTKAFTAAALGMLVDQDIIDWDDTAARRLPGFRVADPYVSQQITIRDMLTHRTGAATHNNVWIAAPFDRTELVRRMRHLPQAMEHRAGYRYNNLIYTAAGEIVGSAANTTWDDFLEERIFMPLNMHRTTTRYHVAVSSANVASPHLRVEGAVTPVPIRNYDALGGAGSIFSSAYDMAQWVRLHLNHGTYNGLRLISESTIREMHRRHVNLGVGQATRNRFPDRTYYAYGLGWRLHDYAGRDVVQHTGTVNFMRSQVAMMPEEGIGVVILGNLTTSALQTALMYRVFDALLGRPERDWSRVFLAASSPSTTRTPARTPGTSPSLSLEAYQGVYADSLYGDLSIALEDERLVLRYSPDYVADLEHWHHDTFRVHWRSTGFGSTMATFTLNRGEVASMSLQGYTDFSRSPRESAAPVEEPTGAQ